MRPLIVCRSDKTKYLVHIARALKKMGAADKFYAYVAYYDQWDQYVRNLDDFRFEKIFGTAEIFKAIDEKPVDSAELKRIETTYGADMLWGLILTERWLVASAAQPLYAFIPFYSKEQKLQYFVRLIQQAEKIFDDTDIDCIIDFAQIGLFRIALEVVAKYRNLPYYHTDNALLRDPAGGDRHFISRRLNENYNFMDPDYHKCKNNPSVIREGRDYLDRFRNSSGSVYSLWYGSGPGASLFSPEILKKKVKETAVALGRAAKGLVRDIKLFKQALSNTETRYNFALYKGNTLSKVVRYVQELYRLGYARLLCRYETTPPEGHYAFMTLHYQPEASTALMAPFEVNQLAVIENIAKALPLDFKLLVKMNKMMVRRDPVAFIRHLQKIPNVYLVDHYANTRHFLEKCTCVVAITGTSALEGALLGKPAILLGDRTMPWHRISAVTHVKNWHDLHGAISASKNYTCDDDDLSAYLQAVHDNSFTLKNNYAWSGIFNPADPACDEAVNTVARELAKTHELLKQPAKGSKAA